MDHGRYPGVSAEQGYRLEISKHRNRAIIAAVVLLALVGVLGVAFAMTAVVFFVGPVRAVALRLVGTAWRLATRRNIEQSLRTFETALRRGLGELRSRPLALALPAALIMADRVLRIVVVWFCFEALGGGVDPGVVLTGFAIDVAVGVMSMVPGGLGVQEAFDGRDLPPAGSAPGASGPGVLPLQACLLMAPFGVSLAFYWYVLREPLTGR